MLIQRNSKPAHGAMFRCLSLLGILFMMLAGLSACSNSDREAPASTAELQLPLPRAPWTMIMYMAADNHAEHMGLFEIAKLQTVGSSEDLRIVVQMDRPQKEFVRGERSSYYYGDWSDARRFYIQQAAGIRSGGDFKVLQEEALFELENNVSPAEMGQDPYDQLKLKLQAGRQEDLDAFMIERLYRKVGRPLQDGASPSGLQQLSVQSAGEISTGDPSYFVDYVTWAIRNFPAERYMVSIVGHGAGMWGTAQDMSADPNDLLTPAELGQALEQIVDETGIGKIDLFIWNACIMDMVDVMGAISPYADYVIASQESLDAASWDYITTLRALGANPAIGTLELAETFVDRTLTYFRDVYTGYPIDTHFVLDPTGMDRVMAGIRYFTQVATVSSLEELNDIGLARNDTTVFYWGNPDTSTADLVGFMEQLALSTGDGLIREAALDVVAAVEQMVLYGGAGEGHPMANGLSIFFPSNRTYYTTTSIGLNPEIYYPAAAPYMEDWRLFLGDLYDAMDGVLEGVLPSLAAAIDPSSGGPYSPNNPVPVTLSLNGNGLTGLQFSVFRQIDGQTTIEYVTMPIGLSEPVVLWDTTLPSLSDGLIETPAALRTEASEPGTTRIYGRYYPVAGGEGFDNAYLIVEDREGGLVTLVSRYPLGGLSREEEIIHPMPGDRFQPTFRKMDRHGYVLDPMVLNPDQRLTFGQEPFALHYRPAQSGSYKLRFTLKDLGNNASTSDLSVPVL